jgi:hypothetical protein
VATFLLAWWRQEGRPIKRFTLRHGRVAFALAAALAAPGVAAVADTGGSWLLVAPPPIPEKGALIRVYAASSEAEVRAAVHNLPDHEQILLVTTAYKILAIPTAVARTEALLDALQDTSAPVSRWRLIGAFDTAALCERERRHALESFERAAERVRAAPADSEELPIEDLRLFEKLTACRMSRCVPASPLPH